MPRRLKIELIPQNCKHHNLRTKYPDEWPELSRFLRIHMHKTCEICGASYDGLSKLEAHEVWDFKKVRTKSGKVKRVQVLSDIQCLCKKCHAAKHIGFTYFNQNDKFYEKVVEHYCEVNSCTFFDFARDQKKAFDKAEKRAAHKWKFKADMNDAWTIVNRKCGTNAEE